MTEPIYIQIHDEIKEAIEAGRWTAGERIPAERELSLQFDVSRMTLRQAIRLLVDEGYLERRVGSGTFVATTRVQENLDSASSFTETMKLSGKKASSRVISYKLGQPTPQEAEALQITSDTDILRMQRVRYGDAEPIAFEVATVPQSRLKGLDKATITDSLYQALLNNGLVIGEAQRVVTAGVANEEVGRLLDLRAGEPVLVLSQITIDNQKQPFEFVRTQYAGSRYEIRL